MVTNTMAASNEETAATTKNMIGPWTPNNTNFNSFTAREFFYSIVYQNKENIIEVTLLLLLSAVVDPGVDSVQSCTILKKQIMSSVFI